MTDEPTPEDKARAKALREEIDRVLHPGQKDNGAESDVSGSGSPKGPLSPRDFIHKRMRELDGKKDKP